MANTGQPVQPGWLTPGEGVLVYYPNQTGTVTDEANLVGGYSQLDQLAGSDSGALTSASPLWADLKVWIDPTGTAAFSPSDLLTLDQAGIASLNLSAQPTMIDSNSNTTSSSRAPSPWPTAPPERPPASISYTTPMP